MAILQSNQTSFTPLERTGFFEEGIRERQHLQSALKSNISVIAPDCRIIAEEFSEWSEGSRRIDLLAVDRNANLVVIELKRDETGFHMELQAIRYASMVSTLTFSRAVEIYQKYLQSISSSLDAEVDLLQFLGWEEAKPEDFAADVRLILVASNFSKELTTSVMWLRQFDLDIRCVRLIPYRLENHVLVDVQQIIPLPEAESYQIKVRQQSEERREARRTARDYTRYVVRNVEYNKRKLVLAVIQTWFQENNPPTFNDLLNAFPQSLHGGSLFVPERDAWEIMKRQGKDRHFLGDNELIRFDSGESYAISNQWGAGNLKRFIDHAKELGYDIRESTDLIESSMETGMKYNMREARQNWEDLVERAERGEEVIITRYGEEVVNLVPVSEVKPTDESGAKTPNEVKNLHEQ